MPTTWEQMVASGKYGPLATTQKTTVAESPQPQISLLPYTPPTNTLTTTQISPQPSTSFEPFVEPPIPNTAGIASGGTTQPDPLSALDQELERRINESIGLEDSLANKGADEKALEQQYGVADAQSGVDDLLRQYDTLQKEREAGRIQLEQEAGVKGITQSNLARQISGNERMNAIKSFELASLISAGQGKLSDAMSKVEKAISTKYDPIVAKLNANTANNERIINSPRYSAEQKARAEAQIQRNKVEETRVEQEKKDRETMYGLALQAQQNGAPTAIVTQLLNAKDFASALTLGQGYLSKETGATIQEYNFYKRNEEQAGRAPLSFDAYQTRDANRKVALAKAGVANSFGLTPNQVFQATQSLKKTTATNTEASRELQRQASILNATWNRLESGAAKDLNGTSQAIITTFNKLLDPTSVVREAEYDRSAAGQALISTIQGKVAAIQQGGPGLTKQSLKELVDLGNTYAKNAEASIAESNKRANEEASYFGLNADLVSAPPSPTSETSSTIPPGETRQGADGKTYKKVDGGWVPA